MIGSRAEDLRPNLRLPAAISPRCCETSSCSGGLCESLSVLRVGELQGPMRTSGSFHANI